MRMVAGSERSRERRALAFACLVHAGAITMLAGSESERPTTLRPPPVDSAPAALEIDLEPPTPEAPKLELAPPPLVTLTPRAERGPAPRPTAEPLAAEVVTEPESTPEADSEPDAAPEPPPDRVVDLGLGPDGWRKWASVAKPDGKTSPRQRRSGRSTFRAPPASTTGGLQEGLEARDRELGLGAAGPVVGALYRAAHTEVAPQLGTAHFRVTLFSSGAVEVSLTSATDQVAGWNAVAARAAEALRSSPQRIPAEREGVSLVVEITAESVFPNGRKRKDLKGPHLEAVAPRLQSVDSAQTELERLNPDAKPGDTVIVDLPGVYIAGTGKVCSYRLGLSSTGPVLSGGCDPSQIGAKAQRMVHTRVIEEKVF